MARLFHEKGLEGRLQIFNIYEVEMWTFYQHDLIHRVSSDCTRLMSVAQ